MNFILRETQPMNIRINGVEYPAIWSFKAISIMENYTELMHLFTLARFKEGRFEPKEFIGALIGMLQAAGVTYEVDGKDALAFALLTSIRPSDEAEIQKQMMKIIEAQGDQPKDGDSKNAKRSRQNG